MASPLWTHSVCYVLETIVDNVVLEALVRTEAVVTMTEAVGMDPRTVD